MALAIASREVDGVTVLELSGRITLGEGSVQLRDAIRDLIAKGQRRILLDLGEVNYIDSSGTRRVGERLHHCQEPGCQLSSCSS